MYNSLIHVNLAVFLTLLIITACSRDEEAAIEIGSNSDPAIEYDSEWVSLWDGETFEGWRASENPDSFTIEGDRIVVDGPRAHLFYEGPVADADFENFEFRAEVYTYPEANSGIFFHTEYQEEGWPAQGYEAQVNATHSDPIKTGSLYGVENVMNDAPHEDEEWFTYQITVIDREITFQVNGDIVMEFTEPEDREGPNHLSSGTFALQAHDPNSRIYFRNIEARVLP